jgi:hypothetical protein
MNRLLVAGAVLLAGIAIAAPTLSWSADPQMAQAAPDEPGRPGMGGMPGAMGDHPGWMHGMMMHRMMQLSPRQRCEEHLARRAGRIAYTAAKLNLTAEQRPLWDKLQAAMQAGADKHRQLCATLPAENGARGTILERTNRREQFLSAHLQGLQQTKPVLEQLYQALTPEQKAIMDHPFRPR